MKKRAIPIYWQFLDKKGASKLAEQQALIRPVLKLLKSYKLVILGDREFHSVELANWLLKRKVYFVFRQKKDTYIKEKGKKYQRLDSLEIIPGAKRFLTGLKVRKEKGFNQGSIGIYWKRKYCGKQEEQPWYLLTNLPSLSEAIKAYKKRVGIEAMFKDCKSGGYNERGVKSFHRTFNSSRLINRNCLYIIHLKRTNNSMAGARRIYRSLEKSQECYDQK